ncbi:hypothetical protein PRIPAC_97340, partial [Pristionchus pacificus]
MTSSRDSSMETSDRYSFGYNSELSNVESSICTAKRLRQRLQRQQSGQSGLSGRRYTGESSECSSLVGTPTDTGRSFTFTTARQVLRDERKPSVTQNLSEMMLEAIHFDDLSLVERLLQQHANKPLSTSPSIGQFYFPRTLRVVRTPLPNSPNDVTEISIGDQTRAVLCPLTLEEGQYQGSTCAVMNTLHMAVAHKQKEIVELLLKNGYDPNSPAQCHCKGNCTATGNIPLTAIMPRLSTHSVAPEMCSTCTQLRVISIVDQTPLGVAVRSQSSELISLLIAYGADVNQVADDDGNTPLMLAVRDSPISWQCLHTLIFFGAHEWYKEAACSEDKAELKVNTKEIKKDPNWVRLQVDNLSQGERSMNKAPLSPKPSAAPSMSTTSMLETSSAKETARRKSLISLQLRQKAKAPKELIDTITWQQAWELLKKMASNPECIETIQARFGKKFFQQIEGMGSSIDRDTFDGHLGGLMHRLIQTAVTQYEQSTPTYKKSNKLSLISLLSVLTTFSYQFLARTGTLRQFSALNTLNKIIDTSLVYDLIAAPDISFHSSRILNRSHAFENEESRSPAFDGNAQFDQTSTVDHVFVYGANFK